MLKPVVAESEFRYFGGHTSVGEGSGGAFGGGIINMSEPKNKMQLFEEKQVRAVWDEDAEKWWFSIVDVCAILTDSDYQTARKYWKVLKGRIEKEGNELVTSCYQLKMEAPDRKMRLTDVADTEQVLRLIQSIPSKKAEPFKLWLANSGKKVVSPLNALNLKTLRNAENEGDGG